MKSMWATKPIARDNSKSFPFQPQEALNDPTLDQNLIVVVEAPPALGQKDVISAWGPPSPPQDQVLNQTQALALVTPNDCGILKNPPH